MPAPPWILRDVRGRPVPLARVRLRPRRQGRQQAQRPALRMTWPRAGLHDDGLGFFTSKRLSKFWLKYRKPIVGGAIAAGLVTGAVLTGGAALAAAPAVLGTVAKGAGSVLGAAGGPEALLSVAGSVLGGRGGGGEAGGGGETAMAAQAAGGTPALPALAAARMPVRRARPAPPAASSGLGGIPAPLLIGGGVAVLVALMLMNQRAAAPAPALLAEVPRV